MAGACRALQVDAAVAGELGCFLNDQSNRSPETNILVIGGRKYPGYTEYSEVGAAKLVPAEQEMVTSQIRAEDISHVEQHVPGLKSLIDAVCEQLQCSRRRIHLIHFLWQWSEQCQFDWHCDDDDLASFSASMVTVVVNCGVGLSGVKMWGFEHVFPFIGKGCACAFPGGATHRTVMGPNTESTSRDIVKVAFFLM